MLRRTTVVSVVCGIALLLIGCASDDSPTNSGGTNRQIVANPSFATHIQEIFDRRGCSGTNCHGAALSAGMDLRAGASYANLVNVDATSESFKRVLPGNAQDSYIIIKLEGRQTVGSQMPLIGPALDSIDLQNIKNWINQGAMNN